MLVVVALVVLMMTVFVSIFQAATGAITVSRIYQSLDQRLRMIDGTMRTDLSGVTAKLTPPLDPKNNLGFFEYSENSSADLQGEDTDDVLHFTATAPDGQPFTGRVVVPAWFNALTGTTWPSQQVLVTSDYAEIIYFLRDGNLYRRVLLVAPDRKGSLAAGDLATGGYSAVLSPFGVPVSWQGMNDISARPTMFAFGALVAVPTPNTLGDLTNRENRFGSPRFCDDFTAPFAVSDDNNVDGVPDFYPTLFPNAFANGQVNYGPNNNWSAGAAPSQTYDTMPFPFLFPSRYSFQPPAVAGGSVHVLDPSGITHNHAPIDVGDSLPIPINPATQFQTWWGLPTWRETMSAAWADPVFTVNVDGTGVQAPGLSYLGNFTPLTFGSSWYDSPTAGSNTFLMPTTGPNAVYKDDLLLTGVRSFDVKAYDPNVFNALTLQVIGSGYVDLGYLGDQNPLFLQGFPNSALGLAQANLVRQGFGHEGRIPGWADPSGSRDFVFNPQLPAWSVDDPSPTTLRLRRTFDTWSTTYTTAPLFSWVTLSNGFGTGPPLYPSYPAPYPIPLRGIQIQIRVTDPSSDHVKVLTIRQDFTDKL